MAKSGLAGLLVVLTAFTAVAVNEPIAKAGPNGGKVCVECELKKKQALLAKLQADIAALQAIVDQVSAPKGIKPCSDGSVNLRAAKIEFKCSTSKGEVFERVVRANFGEAWKDSDGLIWSDVVGRSNQYDAVNKCKTLGGELPSRQDFERGKAKGIREVLPNMGDRCFWSSSVLPGSADDNGNADDAYVFSGNYGVIDNDNRNYSIDSVRCIGR